MDERINGQAEYIEEPTFSEQGGNGTMTNLEERILKLDEEIAAYRKAIEDAEGALDSAEKELDEVFGELS